MRDRGFDAAPIEPAIEQIPINDYLAPYPTRRREARGASVL
jgi:hypothetical protein